MKALSALLAILLASACATAAPKPGDTALYDEIVRADRAMFEAFNSRDFASFEALFSDDFEMYHDTGGLLTKAMAMEGVKSNFAKDNGLRRDLVEGSMEVYPVRDYGAIRTGSHRFCHVEDGKNDCGVFKFVQVWRKQDGKWQLTRSVSYDH